MVESEGHAHAEVLGDFLSDLRHAFVLKNMLVLVNFGNNLEESIATKVGDDLVLLAKSFVVVTASLIHLLDLIWVVELPHAQECFSYVLVWGSSKLVNARVSNLSNFVNVKENIIAEHFSSLYELVYVAETENRVSFDTRNHGVQVTTTRNVLGNDETSSFTKS